MRNIWQVAYVCQRAVWREECTDGIAALPVGLMNAQKATDVAGLVHKNLGEGG